MGLISSISLDKLSLSAATLLLSMGLCSAGVSPLGTSSQDLFATAEAEFAAATVELSKNPVGPLSPFHLALGSSVAEVAEVVDVPAPDTLQARDERYLFTNLNQPLEELAGGVLPAPSGLRVLDGELYFQQKHSALVQASLIVEATASTETAIKTLEDWLGDADFEIVLPGSLNLVIGWRTPAGYLMGTFSDLSIFQLSAFPDRPADLLAGSQIVLYEGLANYSRGLAEGATASDLLPALERVVRWVEATRGILEPVN